MQRIWYNFVQTWAQLLFVLLFGIRVFWQERVPRRGGVLLVANHQSLLDPVIASLGLPRQVSPLARSDLFQGRVFPWLIRSVGALPMKRGTADTAAIKGAIRMLRAGEAVLLFPEGTRTDNGAVGTFHSGMCLIAARGNAPIVPVAIDGAFEAWPRSKKLFRLRRIRVGYGTPVIVGSKKGEDYRSTSERVRGIILDVRRAMRAMSSAH